MKQVTKMLKHVHLSPYRSSMMSNHGRADTLSLNSTMSCSSLSQDPLSSRSSSYTSLNESQSPMVSAISSFLPSLTLPEAVRKLNWHKFPFISTGTENVEDVWMKMEEICVKIEAETRKRWPSRPKRHKNGATERDDGMSLARNVRQDYFAVKITKKSKMSGSAESAGQLQWNSRRRCHLCHVNGAAPPVRVNDR